MPPHVQAPGSPAAITGAVSLRGIFENAEVAPRRDFADRIHVGRTAVEVNRQDGPGARRDGPLDEFRIEISCGRVDINEDRHGSAVRDRFGRSEESVGACDDLVVRLDSECQQAHVERSRATGERHAMLRAAEIGEFPLESLDLLSENERRALANAIERGENLVPEFGVFRL